MPKIFIFFTLSLLISACSNVTLTSRAKFAASPSETNPLKPGETIPDIFIKDKDHNKQKLKDLVNKQNTLLVIYRGGWCPYCSTQLSELRKVFPTAKKMGFQIIAVSPDKPLKLQQTDKKLRLPYQLYSDSSMELAKSFGLAFKVDDLTIEKYQEYGISLIEASGQEHQALPVPAIYIIKRDGSIYFAYFNINYKVRLDAITLLSALKAASK